MARRILADRYELGDPLGRGGTGRVYAALDLELGRSVAVKLLTALADETAQALREARNANRVSHPGVVGVLDVGEDEHGTPFLVMELVSGRSLRQELRERGTPDLHRALDWAAQLADVLHAAHRAGVVHRDLKPENVMVTPGGTLRVLDFGIARSRYTTRATSADIAGTPQYMPPEAFRAGRRPEATGDLYSLGCVLYELITGEPPFPGLDLYQLVGAHQSGRRPERLSAVPAALGPLVIELLDAAPELRPADAAEVRNRLRRIRAVPPPPAGAEPATYRPTLRVPNPTLRDPAPFAPPPVPRDILFHQLPTVAPGSDLDPPRVRAAHRHPPGVAPRASAPPLPPPARRDLPRPTAIPDDPPMRRQLPRPTAVPGDPPMRRQLPRPTAEPDPDHPVPVPARPVPPARRSARRPRLGRTAGRRLLVASAATAAAAGLTAALLNGAPTRTAWVRDIGDGLAGPPALAGSTIYVGSTSDIVYALDPVGGGKKWETQLAYDGQSAWVTVADGTVFAESGQRTVVALNADTGNRIWSKPGTNFTVADHTVYASDIDGPVTAYDAATGTEKWRRTATDGSTSEPTVADGTVYVVGAHGDQDTAVALDAASGRPKWTHDLGPSGPGSLNYLGDAIPVVADGTVYVADANGTVFALDAATGNKKWTVPVGHDLKAALTATHDTVYVADQTGSVRALNPADGQEKWRHTAGDGGFAEPVLLNGTLYLAGTAGYNGRIYALDAATGRAEWDYDLGESSQGMLTVDQGVLYAADTKGKLYAFKPTATKK
ncbi:PQQ-binding-like beta-propeller repeat protein [Kitasatospora sp. NPDC058965]|uniref:serine/threonine-protein kinase n=1 Tax=Kitasatospora sp. NPDC058965 TaxID=3346682 RepID=UPI0036D0C132